MRTLNLIMIIVFYLTLLCIAFSFVIVAIYCRRKRCAEKWIIDNMKAMKAGEEVKSHSSILSEGGQSKFKKILSDYLYGLTRYLSIWAGRIPSHRVRKFLLRVVFCAEIDRESVIYGGFELRSPWNLIVGKSVIGYGALLDSRYGIYVEDNVCLASAVSIYTLQHNVNDPDFSTEGKGGAVIIKHHSWVSSKTTVLPKCIVEEGCVIASGATVTKSTDAYGIYGGLPAKRIAERATPMNYSLNTSNFWHFM